MFYKNIFQVEELFPQNQSGLILKSDVTILVIYYLPSHIKTSSHGQYSICHLNGNILYACHSVKGNRMRTHLVFIKQIGLNINEKRFVSCNKESPMHFYHGPPYWFETIGFEIFCTPLGSFANSFMRFKGFFQRYNTITIDNSENRCEHDHGKAEMNILTQIPLQVLIKLLW